MSSNGKHDGTPDSGISQADSIATAMGSINTLAVWLKDAGLDESAISLRLVRFAQSLTGSLML